MVGTPKWAEWAHEATGTRRRGRSSVPEVASPRCQRSASGFRIAGMRPASFVHVVCLGSWLGCLLVEGVIEALARRDRELLRAVSRLHRSIDLWVEIPAFSGVLASGLVLSLDAAWSNALIAKVALGTFAILANLACLWPVFRRARAAQADDFRAMQRHSL